MCKVSLWVSSKQEQILKARFETGRQIYNALLGEAQKRLALIRQAVGYTTAKKSTDPKRDELTLRPLVRPTTFLLMGWKPCGILDSHVAQKLADRAFEEVQKASFWSSKKGTV